MLLRYRCAALLLLTAALAGCSASSHTATSDPPYRGQLITREAIERSGASNAWEALRRLAPYLSMEESRGGQPTRMTRRGPDSVLLQQPPLVVVDGAALLDFRTLHQVRAQDIASIRVLTGSEGATYYGLRGSAGVILIRTRQAGDF